jgi:hypothetical protein
MIPEVHQFPAPHLTEAPDLNLGGDMLPALVAQVFEEAPLTERGRLLEQLLKPLGLLSLAAVANGIFARITMDQGWYQPKVSPENATRVDARDVIALVSHVQQVSVHAIDGLARVISASPVLASSAAAAMLLTLLHKQAKARAPVLANDFDPIC